MNIGSDAFPWRLRANLSALLLPCIAQKAQGLPSWQTRSLHATSPVLHAPKRV